jgi:hypothetical protein
MITKKTYVNGIPRMVRVPKGETKSVMTVYDEYYGKAADEKPTENIVNGTVFYAMDTGAVWMFDEDAGVWIEQ